MITTSAMGGPNSSHVQSGVSAVPGVAYPAISQPTICLHSVPAGKKRKCVIFDLDAHMQTDTKTPHIKDVLCASMLLLQSLLL